MRLFKPIALILLVVFAAQLARAGTDIRHYDASVKRAAEEVDRIKADSDYEPEGLDAIRKLVLRYEQVEAGGDTITVDNTWLYVLLDSFAAQKGAQERLAILNEAGGRLNALDKQLVAYEESLHRASRQSDASGAGDLATKRAQLRRILDRPEYREKPEDPIAAFIQKVRSHVYQFFARLLQRLFRLVFGAAGEASWLFRGLIIAGLLGVLSLVVVLAAQIVAKRKTRTGKKDKRLVLGEAI